MTDVELDFFFKHSFTELGPARFSEPVEILTTRNLSEIRNIILKVEQYNEKGYYAAGYISYEAAPAFHSKMKVNSDPKMPLIWFGIFREPKPIPYEEIEAYAGRLDWRADTDETAYRKAIHYIKENIEAGNTYQVNHTIRLKADFEGNAAALFNELRKAQQADYCAHLKLEDTHILSASPELFFAKKGTRLQVKPMKGTVKRGKSYAEDKKNKLALRSSEKEQSENVMIVDLLRNDLGRIAAAGSVQVSSLFDVEAYPTVYQMTSTVQADMEPSSTYLDLFEALFPCGSITGAPKLKTMELIHELEPSPREVYCGAIGYFTPEKTSVFNVPIRTVWIDQRSGIGTYGVGGGVTWESTAVAEYDEIAAKGKVLSTRWPSFQLLESLLLEDGKYKLLNEHLDRLRQTAEYFNYKINQESVVNELSVLALAHSPGSFKVRLLASHNGEVKAEAVPVTPFKMNLKTALASDPIDKTDRFFYHKTTHRECYDKLRLNDSEIFDTLLWNADGEVTEFTNGNLVYRINGELLTPPVSSGLLEGTFRGHLIKTGQIKEALLTKKDLKRIDEMWLINSVRGWVPVELIEL